MTKKKKYPLSKKVVFKLFDFMFRNITDFKVDPLTWRRKTRKLKETIVPNCIIDSKRPLEKHMHVSRRNHWVKALHIYK